MNTEQPMPTALYSVRIIPLNIISSVIAGRRANTSIIYILSNKLELAAKAAYSMLCDPAPPFDKADTVYSIRLPPEIIRSKTKIIISAEDGEGTLILSDET